MRQRSHLSQRWRGCTWSGNQAFPCLLLSLSTLGAHIMQPSTLSTASCPKREAMPPGASGHTKPNAQFLTMDGGKQDSGLWVHSGCNFVEIKPGESATSWCTRAVGGGGGPSGSPSASEERCGHAEQCGSQAGWLQTMKKTGSFTTLTLEGCLGLRKSNDPQRVKKMTKTQTSVFDAGWESGKRSSPASQDDGGTNRASGFGKWLLVTVGMKWKPLISIVIGENRTLLYEQGGNNLFIYKCLAFSTEGLSLKKDMQPCKASPVLWQSQVFLPLQWS